MAVQAPNLSPYELRREEMIRERKAFLKELFPEGELAALKRDIAPKRRAPASKPRSTPQRSARLQGPIRRSARLSSGGAKKSTKYCELEYDELPKYCSRPRSSVPVPVELDDDATQYDPKDLTQIAQSTSEKVYDRVEGSTCHQCRQKTRDLKTTCRNKHCVGVRGQFCGPCLRNRYGEDAAEACKDLTWVCPPCRDICNCSFCLPKRGRRPTGILIHIARDNGFDSVHSFLKKESSEE
ncbi:cell division cycle-associated protein 7-like [Sycon ciliatum]|uniref:cell division cycle-associated protein 7-like n=1 Tax=Sycon ciliatum TaxID=27933 RepID=UPI0020AB43EF|eukprot:scpid18279/ scgid30643/ Cell division cycle-associated 7-like protein; Protein JPO2; Transcription factor RAM2